MLESPGSLQSGDTAIIHESTDELETGECHKESIVISKGVPQHIVALSFLKKAVIRSINHRNFGSIKI